jgi:signal peptidase I
MCQVDFQLNADQYFALGDNSAKSRDSRLWSAPQIDRDLLKGKALLIYWPHSWHRIPYVNIPFPYFPNFSRMHFIK